MAKTGKINKNELRRKLVKKFADKRSTLKATIASTTVTMEDKLAAVDKLNRLPRDSSAIRVVERCVVTGRPRGNLRFFGLSRNQFRAMALRGELAGVTKASW